MSRGGIKKNKRDPLPFHPDEVRRKIQASKLVQRLDDHIMGVLPKPLEMSQVRAIDILLKKCIPDLTRTLISADLNVRYVAELPKVLTKEEWVRKYGSHDLELTALPAPTGNGDGRAN